MPATRWECSCILALSLPLVAAGQALRSVYAPAGTLNQYLSIHSDRANAASVMRRYQASKIWIEGRGDQYAAPGLLRAARDDFHAWFRSVGRAHRRSGEDSRCANRSRPFRMEASEIGAVNMEMRERSSF